MKKTDVEKGAKPKKMFKCNVCSKQGHFARDCKAEKNKLQCQDCKGKLPVPHTMSANVCPKMKAKRLARAKNRATDAKDKGDKKSAGNDFICHLMLF